MKVTTIFKNNRSRILTIVIFALFFMIYQLCLSFGLNQPHYIIIKLVVSALIGALAGYALHAFYRLIYQNYQVETKSSEYTEFLIQYSAAAALLVIGTTLVLIIWHQSEKIEWLAYEFCSFIVPIFAIATYFFFRSKANMERLQKTALSVLIFFSVFYVFYAFFFIQHYLPYHSFLLLFLSIVVPSVTSVVIIRKKNPKSKFKISIEFFRGKNLAVILLSNLIWTTCVVMFFTNDYDKSKIVFILTVLTVSAILFHRDIFPEFAWNKVKWPFAARLPRIIPPILAFIFIFWFIQRPIEYYHYSYYFGPISEVLSGKSLLYDAPSQYGYLSIHFIAAVLRMTGASIFTFHYINLAFFALYFVLCVFLLNRIIKNKFLVFIGATLIVGFQGIFSQYSTVMLPSTGFARFCPGILVGWAVFAKNKKLGFWIGSFLTALSVFWSIETAIYVVSAWLAYCAVLAWKDNDKFTIILRNFVFRLVVLLLMTAAVLLTIILLEYRPAAGLPPFSGFWEYALVYKDGYYSLPISAFGNHYLIILILIFSLTLFVRLFLKREKKDTMPALAYFCVIGSAVFSYFISRSHENNIINIAPFYVILIAITFKLMLDTGLIDIKQSLRQFLLPGVIFCFLFYAHISTVIRGTIGMANSCTKSNIINIFQSPAQTPYLADLAKKYRFDLNNFVLLSDWDDYLLPESGIINRLPLNPREMTMILPNGLSKYVIPAIPRLNTNTVILSDTKYPSILAAISNQFTLLTLARIHEIDMFDHILKRVDRKELTNIYTLYRVANPRSRPLFRHPSSTIE